jgi:sorbitol/mannitol transport system substrate-binding protein
MKPFAFPFMLAWLSIVPLFAQQKLVTIATVKNKATIELTKLSDRFAAKNLNIKLNWVLLDKDILQQRVITDISTGSGQFDLVYIDMYETPIFAKRGWLCAMNDISDDYDLDDVFESIRDGLSIDGNLYALPFSGESSILMYRKDLLESKGLTMPSQPTYNDIRKFADALTDKTKSIYGITLRGKAGWDENMAYLCTLINTFGGTWFDLEWHPTINTPEWRRAITFYVDLMRADGPPDASTHGFDECLALFASGKAAMWIDSTIGALRLYDRDQLYVADKVAYANAPIAVTRAGSHGLWSWAFAIPQKAKQPEAAQKFAEWATSKEYVNLVAEDLGWASVPAGTRKSTYENPEYQKAAPFAQVTMKAMETADPNDPCIRKVPYTGIQFVAIPDFPSLGTVVGQKLSDALGGKISVDQALQNTEAWRTSNK